MSWVGAYLLCVVALSIGMTVLKWPEWEKDRADPMLFILVVPMVAIFLSVAMPFMVVAVVREKAKWLWWEWRAIK